MPSGNFITYNNIEFVPQKVLCSGFVKVNKSVSNSSNMIENLECCLDSDMPSESLHFSDSFSRKVTQCFESWKKESLQTQYASQAKPYIGLNERFRTLQTGPLQCLKAFEVLAHQEEIHFLSLLPFEAAHRMENLPCKSEVVFEFFFATMKEQEFEEIKEEIHESNRNYKTENSLNNFGLELSKNTSSEFQKSFENIQENFNAGDIFEVVLSRRFVWQAKASSFQHIAFAKQASNFVRSTNAPFRFCLKFSKTNVFGMSPELLIQTQELQHANRLHEAQNNENKQWEIINKPISGTLRRRVDAQNSVSVLSATEDAAFVSLLNNEKEKSELDMLIDLARNDLNRVCNKVSVSKYRELLLLEKVAHTQATVKGTLRHEFKPLDAVLSCINAGTLVGAPKRKALQIIAQSEVLSREVYGGQIVHCFPDGNVKATILIRTLALTKNNSKTNPEDCKVEVAVQAGATVLRESILEEEYQECGSKALPWLQFLNCAHLAEAKPSEGVDSENQKTKELEMNFQSNPVRKKTLHSKFANRKPKILVIDNEDSFTFNLVNVFEEIGAEVSIARPYVLPEHSQLFNECDAIVLSPGPGSPRDSHYLMEYIEAAYGKKPIFGVCLGHQALCEARGGELSRMKIPLHGKSRAVFTNTQNWLFQNIPSTFFAARYHSLYASKVPTEFDNCARDADDICLAFTANPQNCPVAGVQFHPESFLTGFVGKKIAANWFEKSFFEESQNLEIKPKCFSSNFFLTELEKLTSRTLQSSQIDLANCEQNLQAQFENFASIPYDEIDTLEGKQNFAQELVKIVLALKQKATLPNYLQNTCNLLGKTVLDVCGTGGAASQRLNTSTLVALFAPALNVSVVKHGGRSASGKTGSVDFLESEFAPASELFENAAESLRLSGVCYLPASHTYGFLGKVAKQRKAFGKPTIFNLLGPLLNPVSVHFRLLGVFSPQIQEVMSLVVSYLKYDALVVCSKQNSELSFKGGKKNNPNELYLDEANPYGESICSLVKDGKILFSQKILTLSKSFLVEQKSLVSFDSPIEDARNFLAGESGEKVLCAQNLVFYNLALLAVSLNTNLQNLKEPFDVRVIKKFEYLKKNATTLLLQAQDRRQKISKESGIHLNSPTLKNSSKIPRNNETLNCLNSKIFNARSWQIQNKSKLIAEIKLQAPKKTLQIAKTEHSKNNFDSEGLSLESRVQCYAEADAISIVTHESFGGSLDLLSKVRRLTSQPLLAKDFVRTKNHIQNLKSCGANAILLIEEFVGCQLLLQKLVFEVLNVGCTPVVESTLSLPGKHLRLAKSFAGIEQNVEFMLNARSLYSLSENTLPRFESRYSSVSELRTDIKIEASGFLTPSDVRMCLASGRSALVGNALMALQKEEDILEFISASKKRTPLVKFCGARSLKDFEIAQRLKVDFVGINLIPSSKRYAPNFPITELVDFQSQNVVFPKVAFLVNEETSDSVLQETLFLYQKISKYRPLIQTYGFPCLSGFEELCVVDTSIPGSGVKKDFATASLPVVLNPGAKLASKQFSPCLIAGGLTSKNVATAWKESKQLNWNSVGVDVASGIEESFSKSLGFSEEKCSAFMKIVDNISSL